MNTGLLAVLLFIAAIGAAIAVLSRNERQRLAQQEAEWRADAAARGWSFDTATEGECQRTRWQGQTDGIAWTLEYRRGRHRRKGKGKSDRVHRTRWWANAFHGPTSPVLCLAMNKGQEQPALKLAQSDGMLAALARKAAGAALDTTLDSYFGEDVGRQVDARRLKPVDGVSQVGYLAMAEDASMASRWLVDGCGAALTELVNDPHSALHPDMGRPWVLWIGRQVMLANMRPVKNPDDVARLVAAGVALTQV